MAATTTPDHNDSEQQQQQQLLLSHGLYRRTPLIYSSPMTQLVSNGRRAVYLKLDCLQASGSFKDRGMALLCWQLQQQQHVQRIVSSSGGNAGLAAATVAQKLHLECTVVVPTTTKPMVIEKLKSLGATVQVVGQNWNAADQHVREMVAQDPTHLAYVPPYEHPLLWQGHSSVIDEIYDDWKDHNESEPPPSTIIVSVGGGGLLCGVLEGLERRRDSQVGAGAGTDAGCQVIAAETVGASSFAQALDKGELVQLDAIHSVATSLGALQVSPTALQRSQQCNNSNNNNNNNKTVVVATSVCTDAEAVQACLLFARDHRILVEPACGASLAVVYSERLRNELLLGSPDSQQQGPIVIEVCGGSGVNLDLLQEWKEQFGLE